MDLCLERSPGIPPVFRKERGKGGVDQESLAARFVRTRQVGGVNLDALQVIRVARFGHLDIACRFPAKCLFGLFG